VQDTLDAPDRYDLYISQSPLVNAGAYGFDKPWVVLLSGSLRLLKDDEIEFVMGHELGHVISGHALYHTMMVIRYSARVVRFPARRDSGSRNSRSLDGMVPKERVVVGPSRASCGSAS